jgi:hypothetical protein
VSVSPNQLSIGSLLTTPFLSFFGGISLPMVVASFFIIPDLSRRTPAELDEMFRKGVKPWR